MAAGRGEELMGTVISAVATASGRDPKDVRAEFLKDPKAFYETHKVIIDNTMTKLAMENREYFRSEVLGNSGFSGGLVSFLGAAKEMLPWLFPLPGSAGF